MVIRPALSGDEPELQGLLDDVRGNAAWLPATARRSLDVASVTAGERLFVACIEGRIAGFVSVDEADAFIHHLYVARTMQRLGIGAALLDSVGAWLPYPWRLKCVAANSNALAFYAAQGWVVEAEGRADEGPYLQLVTYRPPSAP